MAIEILKHGASYREAMNESVVPLARRKYTLVCKRCGCKFSFRGTDSSLIGWTQSPDDFNKINFFCSVACPECKTENGYCENETSFEEIKEECI